MSQVVPAELQSTFDLLLSQDALRHFPGESIIARDALTIDGARSLVNLAASLALNESPEDRNVAYEIATRVAALHGKNWPGVVRAAEVILSRLGNFPGCQLLRKRFGLIEQASPLLKLEVRMRELENTNRDLGTPVALTDFQFDALEIFQSKEAVSLSAPTSAGKSFLLGLEVIRQLKGNPGTGIAYVVPTRALIRQVIVDLRALIDRAHLASPAIRSVPRPIQNAEAPNGFVYVLTQERLLSLLNSEEVSAAFSTLIVDEAQEIRSGSRGILLETAIEIFRYKFPDSRVIFASPMVANPERLLGHFKFAGSSTSEEHSPVSQNIVLVDSVPNTQKQASPALIWKDRRIELGTVKMGFGFASMSALKRIASFAHALMERGDVESSCIVYANGANDAETIARYLQARVSPLSVVDSEVSTFATFLRKFVHPDYELAGILKHGIAFHYGTMPSSVRSGIEDLFKARKLKYLCCTSTLLQGVNLPAQHIVIEAPKRGDDSPMERADFLNLAGRAGRLLQEFHGNVWCLMPRRWQKKCFEGATLNLIEPAFGEFLKDGGASIRQALVDESKIGNSDGPVAAMGRLLTEFVQKGRSTEHLETSDVESFGLTLQCLEEFRAKARLPLLVFRRNSNVHPGRLEALYEHLLKEPDLLGLIPLAPFRKDSWRRLAEIFSITQRFLSGVENDSFKFHAIIASKWIKEVPLSTIISEEIKFQENKAPVSKIGRRRIIYGVIDTIEHTLRYTYVKNLRAYNDVLAQALAARDMGSQFAERIRPLHLYMECGASRPATLSLISLGLNRMSALVLAKRITVSGSVSPEECLRRCREAIQNSKGLKLPPQVLREVRTFTGV